VAVAWAKTRGMSRLERVDVDLAAGTIRSPGHTSTIAGVEWDVPTHGTVIGTLLNDRSALASLDGDMDAPPYHAPPQSVVLYIKPQNTWTACGVPIILPASVQEVEIGATLGIVIGTAACRVSEATALDFVAGYTIVNDLCEPHASVFRPAIRQRCRDGFCAIGPWVIARQEVATPDALDTRVLVNGELRATHTGADHVRSAARLIVDVSEFMTLSPGDVLLAGVAGNAPRARANDRVRIEIDGVGALENLLVAEVRS
jgi:5-oxopent-3-ene-1,2,5-tricarboxylate decarboxylase / 2-hydroxyhepta-2,4-diene-1,7-dioate isomerase